MKPGLGLALSFLTGTVQIADQAAHVQDHGVTNLVLP